MTLILKSIYVSTNTFFFRQVFRYEAVLLRARFDANKNETDMIKAKQMLKDGEKEFFEKQHPQPFKCE